MKQRGILKLITACSLALFLINGCTDTTADKVAESKNDSPQVAATTTDAKDLKSEIQERETAWSNADNLRDVNAVAAFYADDAVSLASDKPMEVGNAAIKKDVETYIAARPKGSTTTYSVMDAFGCNNYATEVGTTTRKDSTGAVTYKGKYMALWEKRDGKWLCIRDIGNDDEKKK